MTMSTSEELALQTLRSRQVAVAKRLADLTKKGGGAGVELEFEALGSQIVALDPAQYRSRRKYRSDR